MMGKIIFRKLIIKGTAKVRASTLVLPSCKFFKILIVAICISILISLIISCAYAMPDSVVHGMDKQKQIKGLEETIYKLINKIEKYVNSAKEVDKRTLMESYGFALALSQNIQDTAPKENIERRIIKSLKDFAFEDLRLVKDIELANLASNRENFKVAFNNIRLQFALSKIENLQQSLGLIDISFKKVIKEMFNYLHGMLGGPPIDSRYTILSVGSLATKTTTPYSDIEYIVLVEKNTDESRVYFTNFADLFELLMISFGESPIYKAQIFLDEFKAYFKYIRTGARVDEHKKPQDINRLYGLINTPKEILEKIPKKILHEPGNHTTAALLTAEFLDGDEELYYEFAKLASDVLLTVEYLDCLRKLLEEDIRASIGRQAQMQNSFLSGHNDEVEIKDIVIYSMHLARNLTLFLRSTRENIKLNSNFFDVIDVLKNGNYINQEQYEIWSNLVSNLFTLRLELQTKSRSSKARTTISELHKKFNISTLTKQLQEITDIVRMHLNKKKDTKHEFSVTDLTRQPRLVWNLPRQDHKFVGRRELLEELHAKLHSNATSKNYTVNAVSVCAGLGGVGKTQLALQYIHHTNRHYTLKAWFQAENIDQLKQQYLEFAGKLGYKDSEPSFEKALFYIKESLSRHPGWLLVYDNVTSYEEIKNFLPGKGGSVILTTRQQKWPSGFEKLDINVMTENEAIELIQSLLQRKMTVAEEEKLKELVKAIGYLPLALAQAGAYIKHNTISIADYMKLYKEHEEELLMDDTLPEGVNSLPIATTWNISLDAIYKEAKADNEPPLSLHIFSACAYLAPDNIPHQLLLTWFKENYPKLKKPDLLLPKLIGQLKQYSLLSNDNNGNITIHRLVQAVVRHQHKQSMNNRYSIYYAPLTQEWFHTLIKSLHYEFIKKNSISEDEQRQKNLLPHMQSLMHFYKQVSPENKRKFMATLLNDIGAAFYLMHNLKIELYEQNLATLRQELEDDDLELGVAYELLAKVYGDLRLIEKAKRYLELALTIKQKYYSEDDIEVVNTLTNLGKYYRAFGDFKQAKLLDERLLRIKEKHYGIEHIEVAATLDQLGRNYRYIGDSKHAKALHERALAIKKKHYGEEHVQVANTLNFLGSDYRYLGDINKAKELHERALEIKNKYYGEDHIIVAIALDYLGNTLRYFGQAKEAKLLHERSLVIKKNNYGSEHIEIAYTLDHLGRSYRDLGDYSKAKEAHESSIKIKKKHYGENHIACVCTLEQLAKDYKELGDTQQYKTLYETTLKIKEQYYGMDHPEVAEAYSNLGSARIILKDFELGKNYLERALRIKEQYYGSNNLRLVETLVELSLALKALKKAEQAEFYLERAVNIRGMNLGQNHILTLKIKGLLQMNLLR